MMNLAEYRKRPALLADWLPWAGLVAPGVVLNKDGSFQRTARFRGPDLDSATQGGVDWRERLESFISETDRFFDLLDGVMPEIVWLDDSQTLTYLHATVSTRHYPVAVPEHPFYLDALLADSALLGGLAPMLGDQHLRVASVRGFPTSTWPGLL